MYFEVTEILYFSAFNTVVLAKFFVVKDRTIFHSKLYMDFCQDAPREQQWHWAIHAP